MCGCRHNVKTPVRHPRPFYRRDSEALARALIGQTLVRILDDDTRLAGRIVEVEAYLGEPDRAAHSFGRRRTPRNESMYLDAGHAYVYLIYGIHYCMNIVAGETDQPVACLLRALEPTEGLDRMQRNRAGKIPHHRLRPTDLCSGPAKITQALAIDRSLDGIDLTQSNQLFLEPPSPQSKIRNQGLEITLSPRIGVAYAKEWAEKPLRFHEKNNPHVSR